MKVMELPASPLTRRRRSGAYSIGLLFYITTLAAILNLLCQGLVGNTSATWPLVYASLTGFGVAGSIVGTIVATRIRFDFLTATIGGVMGILAGALAGWFACIDPSHFQRLMWISAGCCWLLVVVTLALNRIRP